MLVGVEPDLVEIMPRPAPVHDEEPAVGVEHEKGVVPDIAGVADPLPTACPEGAIGGGVPRVRADQDQPGAVLQGIEKLRAQRMALHDLDADRQGTGLGHEEADVHHPAFRAHIDARKAIAAGGETLIDRLDQSSIGLDDLAEGGECRFGEGGDGEAEHGETFAGSNHGVSARGDAVQSLSSMLIPASRHCERSAG